MGVRWGWRDNFNSFKLIFFLLAQIPHPTLDDLASYWTYWRSCFLRWWPWSAPFQVLSVTTQPTVFSLQILICSLHFLLLLKYNIHTENHINYKCLEFWQSDTLTKLLLRSDFKTLQHFRRFACHPLHQPNATTVLEFYINCIVQHILFCIWVLLFNMFVRLNNMFGNYIPLCVQNWSL